MKCGACRTQLTKETDEYPDGKACWWLCETCRVSRELEPYDMPETEAERELWNTLFTGAKYPQPLSEDSEGRFADLTAALVRLRLNTQQQEP